ncbi:hypothetical protein HOLleu_32081 [Holothuria leucospilota]|uniref:Uncharacterized protein n=1 Tax=Holothuria leucospilota TaxID=206669 RepID=A0A9Q1BHP0_HOLLE|nr:hypothetical protein HOLleu_32081 [Holothuria leucospilota]
MGALASIQSLAKNILLENGLGDREDVDAKLAEVEERLSFLQENTNAKLKNFYNEILLEASGSEGTSVSVPICNVVDKVESTYVGKSEVMVNALFDTIHSVVESALGGDWKESVSTLIGGTLEALFGATKINTTGMTEVKRTYNVVWAHNALIRLDILVTKTDLNQMAGLKKSTETFGGYIMVVSVVDMQKVKKEVFMYEFSQFIHEISKEDPEAIKLLNAQIRESKEIIESIGGIYEGFLNIGVGGNVYNAKPANAEPENAKPE